jgi:hypothetical protein
MAACVMFAVCGRALSLNVVDLGVFAGWLSPVFEVVDNSVQQ